MQGDRRKVISESADLLYHLVVLWAETGIVPDEVWAEMDRREQLYGIAEKLMKNTKPLTTVTSLSARRRNPVRRSAR